LETGVLSRAVFSLLGYDLKGANTRLSDFGRTAALSLILSFFEGNDVRVAAWAARARNSGLVGAAPGDSSGFCQESVRN